MKIFRDKSSVLQYVSEQKSLGKSVGLIPTMGALHSGHLTLVEQSQAENDISICSIYVNPTQFDNTKDLTSYPRTWDADTALLIDQQCDAIFAPTDSEMYSNGLEDVSVSINFGKLERLMEGKHRTGHFNGVGLVVSKLFNIVKPNKAYFGQKDLQQFAVINKMVIDLSFDIKLKCCKIVREKDGLAMSSRNVRLSERERFIAPTLNKALESVKIDLQSGKSIAEAKDNAIADICKHKDFKIEYLEIVDTHNLQPIQSYERSSPVAVCVAAHLGNVRLIDNLIIENEF
ncbi:MAG: pantoate--beta-alanine ligase [Arenicella sp.]|jgi:pantoate--beta-alanine ligase